MVDKNQTLALKKLTFWKQKENGRSRLYVKGGAKKADPLIRHTHN